MTNDITRSIEIQRHNGHNPYGPWLGNDEYDETHGEIPGQVYEAAADEMIETDTDAGHIVIGGQHYDWRKTER